MKCGRDDVDANAGVLLDALGDESLVIRGALVDPFELTGKEA